ncbi:proline dehydrogenase family protein [Chitinophaga nivalis]|uniref:Proline dehydrogenase family protein n=1 Tax=Chitinophaga nivalis TaxID=2991709 RepID=A0ABT3IR95_9BACT|nr:proline dehydrogenase family protein [Chitinophaga nivalis]MCW3463803.1 proline dehydrogenase family protein [Chitinophaga nivalis]MCW3486507.1 proline dehydrogenase family protein [Chitinophaga nivalis]
MEKQLPLSFDNTAIAFEAKTDKALKKADFLFSNIGKPWLVKFGAIMTPLAFKLRLPIKGIIKSTIFSQFCGGETLEEAAHTALQLGNYHVGVVLDYGVEAMEGEHSYDAAVPEFIRAIKYAASKPDIPFIAIKITGFARFELLEKLHARETLTPQEQQEYTRVRSRVYAIAEAAAQHKVGLLIDAEESWIQGPVDELTDEMMSLFNKNTVIVYNTFQMYCHDRFDFLKVSLQKATQAGYLLGAKLVRGAYMEKENKRAAELNYPTPIQPSKAATDKDYDAAVQLCIDNLDKLSVFIGTHNENSCMLAARTMDSKGIPHNHPHVNFSQLLGMSDNITFNLAHAGYHVTKYLPYGPVKDVMPYLIRRAQENTSIAGQMGRELGLIRKELKRRAL